MTNKSFGLLLKVINLISIISLEKYWKNGFKFTFRKTAIEKEDAVYHRTLIPVPVVAAAKIRKY